MFGINFYTNNRADFEIHTVEWPVRDVWIGIKLMYCVRKRGSVYTVK